MDPSHLIRVMIAEDDEGIRETLASVVRSEPTLRLAGARLRTGSSPPGQGLSSLPGFSGISAARIQARATRMRVPGGALGG